MQVRVILTCAFGVDLFDKLIPWRENGVATTKTYSEGLKWILVQLPNRALDARFHIFPKLLNYFFLPSEKELVHNIEIMRNELKKIVLDKKA
mmetsp:Transcript_30457/g.29841  ORF Transcript_30457/g.29841 Transcript_30457/m.29841 type:complete len:92 (+) Transcript_30457:102-377(+)